MPDNIFQKIFQPGARGKIWWAFAMIIVLAMIGLFVDGGQYYNKAVNKYQIPLPKVKEVPFRLGLDLSGGTHLVYKADISAIPSADRSSAVEGVRDVIERRINVFGVSEPIVQTNRSGEDYQVIVELAGIKDVNQAIKMIGETPLLEFKEQNTEKRDLTADEKKLMDDFNKNAEKRAIDVLGKVVSGGDFAALAKDYSEDEQTKSNGGDQGWITDNTNPELVSIASKLKVGEVTKDITKITNGYIILKLDEKKIKTSVFDEKAQEKEVKASHLLICFTGSEKCESNLTKEEALAKIQKIKEQATPQNFVDLVKQNSTEPGARESGGDLGWFGSGAMVEPFERAVFAQKVGTISDVVETQFGYHLIYKKDERIINEYKVRTILTKTKSAEDYIGKQDDWKNTELTGKNLQSASVQFNQNDNTPTVSLVFDDEGGKMFSEITGRNVGKPVAIYLDNIAISTPTVNEQIKDGKAIISGKFSIQEAKLLAQRLNAGALPVPINLISQQTIGASLGQESVTASVYASILGFILVAIFMIIFYRLPGFLSVLALIIYSILVMAIFKLWPVTLTLAGLAGFVMSIGMAVDANVLIFSRLREEIQRGKPLSLALEEGFRRAWPSIRDSNVSTLITCFILILFSTSIIKGFAITLTIGVLVSMFSAIFITRNILQLIPSHWLEKRNWLIGVVKK
jgi:protein-export membrane protein SecD